MKSKEEIEIEFSRAMVQAQELEDVATAMLVLANDLNGNEITKFERSWKGSSADALSLKWRHLIQDMIDTAQGIEQISRSIRTTADLIYKAEKAAVMMAYY